MPRKLTEAQRIKKINRASAAIEKKINAQHRVKARADAKIDALRQRRSRLLARRR